MQVFSDLIQHYNLMLLKAIYMFKSVISNITTCKYGAFTFGCSFYSVQAQLLCNVIIPDESRGFRFISMLGFM